MTKKLTLTLAALAMATGCTNCNNNNDNKDAGPVVVGGKGDGKIVMGGVEKDYSIDPLNTRLLILSLRKDRAACSVFHNHAVASLATSYDFKLNKDTPASSTLTAKVDTNGLDPDQPAYRAVFDETKDVDGPSDSQKSDVRTSVKEQVDAANNPFITFAAANLTTLDGDGTAPVQVTLRGQTHAVTMTAKATWAGDKLTITGKADLDGAQFGMPVGTLKDCIEAAMKLDMVLTFVPGNSTLPTDKIDGGKPFVATVFDGGQEGCAEVGYDQVQDILNMRCVGCHSATPKYGASVPLTSYGDFQHDSQRNPGVPMYASVVERIHAGSATPMPPACGGDPVPGSENLPDSEYGMIVKWAEGSGKLHSCTVDAGSIGITPMVPFMGIGNAHACAPQGDPNWTDIAQKVFDKAQCTVCHIDGLDPLPAFDSYGAGLATDGTFKKAAHPFYAPLSLWEAAYVRLAEDGTMPPGAKKCSGDGVEGDGTWNADNPSDLDIETAKSTLLTWLQNGAPETQCDGGPRPDSGSGGVCVLGTDAGRRDAGPAVHCPTSMDAGPPGPLSRVTVQSPNGGETWGNVRLVTWQTEGSSLSTATISMTYGGSTTPLSTADIPNTGCYELDTRTTKTFDGTDYKIKVDVKGINADGGTRCGTRTCQKSDDSNAEFTISNCNYGTTVRYSDIKSLLGTNATSDQGYCASCHVVATPHPELGVPQTFRLDMYKADDAGVIGAYNMRQRISANVLSGFMPLNCHRDGGPPCVPDGSAQQIVDWANGGAPP